MRITKFIPWLFCSWILISGFLPEWLVVLGEFNRNSIAFEHHYWRVISGQWLHFGINHSLMNGLCLCLIQWQLLDRLSLKQWLSVQAFIQLAVGLGLLWFSSQVEVYRGFSGAFCGLLAFGLLMNVCAEAGRDRWLMLLVYGGLTTKILFEQMPGYNVQYLQGFIGVSVATDAHLFGFISGSFAALSWLIARRYLPNALLNSY